MTLSVQPITTRIFHPGQSLLEFVTSSISRDHVTEKMVVAVTSKIVSLAEDRIVAQSSTDKATLVRAESDAYLGEIGYGCFLTIKNGLLIASAGIDESNSETGGYILYPKDPFASARELWQGLKTAWGLRELGVILTDSHTTPLRRGVTGVALSYCGFQAVRNLVGQQDLFGRELRMTQMNLADGLAAAAVLMMGEGRESRPLAILRGADVTFADIIHPTELQIPLIEDLYYPLLQKALVP